MKTNTIHYLTQEELKQLLSTIANKRDKALFLLAYSYGLRASEVGLLRREDIDFDRLKVRIQRIKGSISSEYPLRPEVAKALKSYLRGRKDNSETLFPSSWGFPISRRTLDYLMKRYGDKAGIPKEKGLCNPKLAAFVFSSLKKSMYPGFQTFNTTLNG